VTVSLPTDLVRRLDRRSRAVGTSRSGLAESWLRAGERQSSLSSLERELETYYSQRIEEEELGRVLGEAAQEVASQGRQRRGLGNRSR
jgi:hypothetical protein